MIRSIIAVIAGVVAATAIAIFGEAFALSLIVPPGEFVTAAGDWVAFESLPISAKASALAVCFAGSFGGGVVASFIARKWAPAAWVVAATLILFCAGLPHPLWVKAVSVPIALVGAFLAVKATGGYYGRPATRAAAPGL